MSFVMTKLIFFFYSYLFILKISKTLHHSFVVENFRENVNFLRFTESKKKKNNKIQ